MAASLLPMSRKLAEQKIEDQILMRKLEDVIARFL